MSSLGASIDCSGQAAAAISADASLGTGFYLALPAVVLTWLAQLLVAVHAATLEAEREAQRAAGKSAA